MLLSEKQGYSSFPTTCSAFLWQFFDAKLFRIDFEEVLWLLGVRISDIMKSRSRDVVRLSFTD